MTDLPMEVTMHPERYSHMIQRKNAFGGFKDLREKVRLSQYKTYTCEELGGKPQTPSETKPRILDYIMYNGEQDILEVRLNTLGPIVDKFLLAETNWTFTGKSKEFKFPSLKNNPTFAKYWDKIVHVQVDPPLKDEGHWAREHHNRNQGLKQGLQLVPPKEGDFIFMSDLDEIWRPSVAEALTKCTDFEHPIFTLSLAFHYYSYEYKRNDAWGNGRIMRWSKTDSVETVDCQKIRYGLVYQHVPQAGWHCSWCFGNMTEVLDKVQSYSHQEHNRPEYLTRENILSGFRYGYDLFGRNGDQFQYVEDNLDVPDWIAANRERFEYALYRRNEWAGFVDIKEELTAKQTDVQIKL
ncbi:hypothetical protein BCR33DRAFT_1781 [Rhizoclosmatium globosum]|uniref:Glycosyltransferase family 17 protein n=1 Tax=Rhizoclosmatium globosum TaxID=329046 RepID=A0A1Y2D2H6_9FUNG|nr:hypothetical protein BCR33DRAFT_1781 [Rhizoclosmatium globosum]|eukprot:ORY53503.1 hypothetical protein BCR33DRAFT_1781 [Rhizoclosmatium globosum]